MYFIIGPVRSAESMARKVGLRRDEWVSLVTADDLERVDARARNLFLETHDAWQLREYAAVVSGVNGGREEEEIPA